MTPRVPEGSATLYWEVSGNGDASCLCGNTHGCTSIPQNQCEVTRQNRDGKTDSIKYGHYLTSTALIVWLEFCLFSSAVQKKNPSRVRGYGCGGDLKRQAKQSRHFALMFGFQRRGMHTSVSVRCCALQKRCSACISCLSFHFVCCVRLSYNILFSSIIWCVIYIDSLYIRFLN